MPYIHKFKAMNWLSSSSFRGDRSHLKYYMVMDLKISDGFQLVAIMILLKLKLPHLWLWEPLKIPPKFFFFFFDLILIVFDIRISIWFNKIFPDSSAHFQPQTWNHPRLRIALFSFLGNISQLRLGAIALVDCLIVTLFLCFSNSVLFLCFIFFLNVFYVIFELENSKF